MSKIGFYTDIYGYEYKKTKDLSEGGQGKVVLTNVPDKALKLVKYVSEEHEKNYKKTIQNLQCLPLPKDIKITRPISLLTPTPSHMGYVMLLLGDMVPIFEFWVSNAPLEQSIPPSLSKLSKIEGKEKFARELAYYIQTGASKRRLLTLYKTAILLHRLHSNGFYYGDLSHQNVFVSESLLSDLEFDHTWLIDTDNIGLIGSNQHSLYSPYFGAPEIINQKSFCSPESDCFSFAILAFWMLMMGHPFEDGDKDIDSDNWDSDTSPESEQELIPWIDDEDDDSNRWEAGLPRETFLNDSLRQLFQKTFSIKGGLINPSERPKMALWVHELLKAHDTTLVCQCGMSYPKDLVNCPFCDSKAAPHFVLNTYSTTPEKKQLWEYHSLPITDNKLSIPMRVFAPYTMTNLDTPVLEISIINDKISLSLIQDNRDIKLEYLSPNGSRRSLSSHEITFTKDQKISLYSSPPKFSKNKYEYVIEISLEEHLCK